MSQLIADLLQIDPAHHLAAWGGSLNDAGLNILGIPWWVWLIGAAVLAIIAIAVAPALLEIAPEILEALGFGAEFDSEAAIAEEEKLALERMQELASRAELSGGDVNCAWKVREMDEAFGTMLSGGNPDPWAPYWFDAEMSDGSEMIARVPRLEQLVKPVPPQGDMAAVEALEQEYGSFFQESSMQQIAEQLQGAGNGARGIVYITDGADAHVFNAVNYGGKVFFVDGQAGTVWTSTAELPGTWLGTNPEIEFLPTAG